MRRPRRAEGLDFRRGGRVHGNTFDLHRLLHFARARGLQAELQPVELFARAPEQTWESPPAGRL